MSIRHSKIDFYFFSFDWSDDKFLLFTGQQFHCFIIRIISKGISQQDKNELEQITLFLSDVASQRCGSNCEAERNEWEIKMIPLTISLMRSLRQLIIASVELSIPICPRTTSKWRRTDKSSPRSWVACLCSQLAAAFIYKFIIKWIPANISDKQQQTNIVKLCCERWKLTVASKREECKLRASWAIMSMLR